MTHLRLTIQKTPYQTTTKNRTTKQPPPPSSDEKPDSDAELVLAKTRLYIQYIYLYITHLVRPSRKVMHTTYIRIMANIYIYILVHLRRSADEPVAATDTTKLRTNEHVSIVVAAELPFTYTQLTRACLLAVVPFPSSSSPFADDECGNWQRQSDDDEKS